MELIVIGAGGNSKVIIDTLILNSKMEPIRVLGILDDDSTKKEVMGYPVLGPISLMENYLSNSDVKFINAIGNNYIRKEIYCRYNVVYYTVIHPSVILGTDVAIGEGSVLMPGVIVNNGTRIGKGTLINTGAIVEHDNCIGDFTHIASGVVTAGNVTIGSGTMLGTGTKVIQGIQVGENTMIGAGAVVVKDIPSNCTAVGVPAKVIK